MTPLQRDIVDDAKNTLSLNGCSHATFALYHLKKPSSKYRLVDATEFASLGSWMISDNLCNFAILAFLDSMVESP